MLTARDVMQPNVITVSEDMLVSELASLLLSKGFSGAPVSDTTGTLVGVVSYADIAAYSVARTEVRPTYYRDLWADEEILEGFTVEDFDLSARVRDIMTPAIYQVPETAPVEQVVELMRSARIHRVLVTSQNDLAGIITTTDLIGLIPRLLLSETLQ